MLYRLKIRFFRTRIFRRINSVLNRMLGKRGGVNLHKVIRKYVAGRSFADIGGLWGLQRGDSFFAEECGAKKVILTDIYPASKEFLEEKKRRNSSVEFIQGDLNLKETINKIGSCDVVFCKGVLYHQPNPLHFLLQLRMLCKEILMLQTALIPEMIGIRNAAIFYPFLEEKQRKLYKRSSGRQRGLSTPYEPESGYGNWFWGLSPSCVESMLNCAGFKVENRYINFFTGCFICRPDTVKFSAVSGEWTIPKHYSYKP